MARIDKDFPMKQELDAVKGEVIRAVNKGSKSKHALLGCSLFVLAVFLFLMTWLAWTIASTGLMTVPFFSGAAYEVPEPTRQVIPGVPVETVIQTQVASELARMSTSGEGGSISVDLPESALTTSLQKAIESSASEQFVASSSQIAVIENSGLEVFLPLANNEKKSAFVLLIAIHADENGFAAELIDVHLGAWNMPELAIHGFIQPLVNSAVDEMNRNLSNQPTVTQIDYGNGTLTLHGSIETK